jgi:hypothetical protein
LKAIKALIEYYKLHGHALKTIRLDGFRSFTSEKFLKKLLSKGIKVQIASPHRHARKAERAIRFIKSLSRAHIADLKFKMPGNWLDYLVKWACQSSNFVLHSNNKFLSPHTIFTGQPVTTEMFKTRFLEVVEVPMYSNVPKDSDSKTFSAIVLARDDNFLGQLIVGDLSSSNPGKMKIFRRHQIHRVREPKDMQNILDKFGATIVLEDLEDDEIEISFNDEYADSDDEDQYQNWNPEEKDELTIDTDTDTDGMSEVSEELNTASSKSSREPAIELLELSNQTNVESMKIDSDDFLQVKLDKKSGTDTLNIDNSMSIQNTDSELLKSTAQSNSSSNTSRSNSDPADNSDLQDNHFGNDKSNVNRHTNVLSRFTRSSSNSIKWSEKEIERRHDIDRKAALKAAAKIREDVTNIIANATLSEFSIVQESIRDFQVEFGYQLTEEAIWLELKQMIDKDVWKFLSKNEYESLVKDANIKILPSTTILKAKYNAFLELEKIKARVCACGNFQRFLLNDIDVYAPTASAKSLLLCLAIAAKHGLHMESYDVSGAFLNATLDRTEYMLLNKQLTQILVKRDSSLSQFIQANGCMVVALLKCIYGLRQSPARWYETVSEVIVKDLGFTRSSFDECIYFRNDGVNLSLLILYVDDFLLLSSVKERFTSMYNILQEKFKLISRKSGDKLSFLGLQIIRDPISNDYSVSLEGFIDKMGNKFADQLVFVKAVTPWSSDGICSSVTFQPNCKLETSQSLSNVDPDIVKEYRSLVMSAMYVGIKSRPDILVGTTMLATKQLNPNSDDFEAILRIIKYLVNTRERKLVFRSNGKLRLHCFADASHSTYANSHSHGGSAIYLDEECSSPFAWESKKISIVCKSPKDAEAIQADRGGSELVRFQDILTEFGIECDTPILHEDNTQVSDGANKVELEDTLSTKRSSSSLAALHELVSRHKLIVKWIETKKQRADGLTKTLANVDFQNFISFLYRIDSSVVEAIEANNNIYSHGS